MRNVRSSSRLLGAGGVFRGGVCLGGGLSGGVHLPFLRTEFLTHACKNITFPQLRLRTVTIKIW